MTFNEDTCARPAEGWSEPDARGHVTFTMYDRATEDAPHRDGFYPFFVAVHGSNFTKWSYLPVDQMHPAATLTGGKVPQHLPGAYPRLSCCGGPVVLVPA